MKHIEFTATNGTFDINDFINRCDAATMGEEIPPAESKPEPQAPIPAAVPVADGADPICYSPLEEVLEELRMGRLILMTDDPHRENEADLVCAGQFATPQNINFMATHARGLICVPMAPERVDALGLPMQAQHNTEKHHTAFTVSVDAREGTTTGISAFERSLTTMKLADAKSTLDDFVQPGHCFPLRAVEGGVIPEAAVRRGHPGQCSGASLPGRAAGTDAGVPGRQVRTLLRPA